jgi:hypothetical protein
MERIGLGRRSAGMKNTLAVTLTLLALGVGSASAGGFATAGVAPPGEIEAGQIWDAQITIKQHGVSPLAGVEPTLTIRRDGTSQTFAAEPTGAAGVYVAHVEFPSAGQWRYEVNDGFGPPGMNTHTFAPVDVVAGSTGGSTGDGGLSSWWLAAALAALGMLAAGLFARRRWPPRPAPVS